MRGRCIRANLGECRPLRDRQCDVAGDLSCGTTYIPRRGMADRGCHAQNQYTTACVLGDITVSIMTALQQSPAVIPDCVWTAPRATRTLSTFSYRPPPQERSGTQRFSVRRCRGPRRITVPTPAARHGKPCYRFGTDRLGLARSLSAFCACAGNAPSAEQFCTMLSVWLALCLYVMI